MYVNPKACKCGKCGSGNLSGLGIEPTTIASIASIASSAASGGSFLSKLFGGGSEEKRAQKAQAAVSLSANYQARDLQDAINKIRTFLTNYGNILNCKSGAAPGFGCQGSETSTQARACFMAACTLATSLGWTGQDVAGYADTTSGMKPWVGCQPYDVNFCSALPSLRNFFLQILPVLEAELAKALQGGTVQQSQSQYQPSQPFEPLPPITQTYGGSGGSFSYSPTPTTEPAQAGFNALPLVLLAGAFFLLR